jgi:hypothetical protein
MKPESDSPQRRDVYTRVTNQIIAELERGVPTYRLWRSNRMLGAQCGLRIPNFPVAEPENLTSLQARPRSVDRTRSPAAVSRKREYFKYRPETIGYSGPEMAKFRVWRPAANSQKPAIGGHFLDC